MPRPPILPTIDWPAIYAMGIEYGDWLKEADPPEHAQQIDELRAGVTLTNPVKAYLGALDRDVYVIAIAEAWCGDVVRHVPVLQAIADAAPRLHVRFIRRDQAPDVFARFLTNGGEAIPKFVFLSEQFVECGNWGPMPEACRKLIARGKACGDVGAARTKVSALYAADPTCDVVVEELLGLIDIAASQRV